MNSAGGPCYISKSGDLHPLECCEIAEKGDSIPANLKASDILVLKLSLLSGNTCCDCDSFLLRLKIR